MARQDESQLWNIVKNSAPATYALQRLEARHPPGISDVLWTALDNRPPSVCGFLELKDQEQDVRPQQGIFLREKWRQGVPAAALLRLRTELFLIPGGRIDLDNRLHLSRSVFICTLSQLRGETLWTIIRATHSGTYQ